MIEKQHKKNPCSRLINRSIDGFDIIDTERISFISLKDGVLKAHMTDNKEHILNFSTLDSVEEKLNPERFYRANRQYIVHVNAIVTIKNMTRQIIKLIIANYPSENIYVSKDKNAAFMYWLTMTP